MSDKLSVKSYLQELKQVIGIREIVFLDRPKNSIQHLAYLSITANMRKEIILSLKVEDYSEGPIEETQYGGTEMWVFGKIKSQEIYIKINF